MGISLTTPPAAFGFSGDKISAVFASSSMNVTNGVAAINDIQVTFPLVLNTVLEIKYGQKVASLLVSNDPDIDGTKMATSLSNVNALLNLMQSNFTLSNDFDFSIVNGKIRLTAKSKGIGYNISPVSNGNFNLVNSVVGVKEVPKANYTMAFRLYIENAEHSGFTLIYDAPQSVLYGSNGNIVAQIGDKLHSAISDDIRELLPDQPGSTVLECKVSCRKYYFEFAESYGDPAKVYKVFRSDFYSVIHGGLSYLGYYTQTLQKLISPGSPAADRFLLQGKALRYAVRIDQPQYLYFFNTRASRSLKLFCRLGFTDGSNTLIIPYAFTAEALRKYAFNVSAKQIFNPANFPGKTLQWCGFYLVDEAGQAVSEQINYRFDYSYRPFIRTFLNWSSWGTFDTRYFYGMGSMEFDQVQQVAERIAKPGDSIMKGNSLVYDIAIQTKFSLTTGFCNRDELLMNKDFFASVLKYRYVNGKMLPVQVTSKNVPEISDEDNGLHAQKFEYQYLFDDTSYTELEFDESRSDSAGSDWSGPGTNPGEGSSGGGGIVRILNQNNQLITSIAAPADYSVIQISGIRDNGNGNYINSIIDKTL